MQVSVETTFGLERRLTVGVPSDRIESEIIARLEKASKTVRLAGFRPGKVPMKVMKQRFGAGVRQEVLGEIINQSFQEAIIQEDLKPAGTPNIEPKKMASGEDVEYIATFEVMPEITTKKIGPFDIEKPVVKISEEDIDQIIDVFRKQNGNWLNVDRSVCDGDKVNIDFKGIIDGAEFEGGSAKAFDLEIGSNSMINGFEDGIVGASKNEEISLSLKFPDQYQKTELQGKQVEFDVKINEIKELEPAPVDEKLFSAYGIENGDEDTFRSEILRNMTRELGSAIKSRVRQQVMDRIIEEYAELEVPSSLVAQEIQSQRSRMFQNFSGQNDNSIDLQSILPDEMFSETAQKRVKLGLILREYIRDFNLEADAQTVKQTIEELASTYEQPDEVIQWYYSNQEQLSAVESQVIEGQLVDKFLEHAVIKERPCTYKEALTPSAQDY